MRLCNAKGCKRASIGSVPTPYGSFDACGKHKVMFEHAGEVTPMPTFLPIRVEKGVGKGKKE
jgi:hypothetical protein